MGAQSNIQIIPMVELARAVFVVDEIAVADERVCGLFLGGGDLAADLGNDGSWENLLFARSRIVAAAATSGIASIDVPYFKGDEAGLKLAAAASRKLGMTGKAALFLTLAIGFWFGSLKFGSFSLGVVPSTLIAALLIGQLGIKMPGFMQQTFFLSFLFAIGYSVGPQFFASLKKDALPQVGFTLIMCASGILTAWAIAKLMGYGPGISAGLLAGGYTNSGTLGSRRPISTRWA